eukprot:330963-Chlamydomonas_euryale.AAC.2
MASLPVVFFPISARLSPPPSPLSLRLHRSYLYTYEDYGDEKANRRHGCPGTLYVSDSQPAYAWIDIRAGARMDTRTYLWGAFVWGARVAWRALCGARAGCGTLVLAVTFRYPVDGDVLGDVHGDVLGDVHAVAWRDPVDGNVHGGVHGDVHRDVHGDVHAIAS